MLRAMVKGMGGTVCRRALSCQAVGSKLVKEGRGAQRELVHRQRAGGQGLQVSRRQRLVVGGYWNKSTRRMAGEA